MLRISLVSALLAAASADILVRDDFSTNGNLVGSTPDVGGAWVAHSGTTGPITVSQGAITVRGENASYAEDCNSIFTAVSTGSVYARMDLNYPAPSTTTGTSVTYFTHFMFGTGTTSFGCRVTPRDHTSTGFKLAIFGGTESATSTTAAELAYGTTFRLVFSFDTVTDKCSLWVDPTSEASPSILSTGTYTAVATVNAIAFRQASATPPWALSIRNLIVATTFSEANASPPPPPLASLASPPPPLASPPPPASLAPANTQNASNPFANITCAANISDYYLCSLPEPEPDTCGELCEAPAEEQCGELCAVIEEQCGELCAVIEEQCGELCEAPA